MQNGHLESFSGKMRVELQNESLFLSLVHAHRIHSPRAAVFAVDAGLQFYR